MGRKKKEVNKIEIKYENPTPPKGQIRSDRQLFTYSENKLLDQITTEIMQAWAKDLKDMRKLYKQVDEIIHKIEMNIDVFNHEINELQARCDKLNKNIEDSYKSKKWWQFWR